MPEKRKSKRYWTTSCNCDLGCSCLFFSDPTKGYCDRIDTLRFTQGNYGKVKLGGLSIALMAKAVKSHFKDYEFEIDNTGKDCKWAWR